MHSFHKVGDKLSIFKVNFALPHSGIFKKTHKIFFLIPTNHLLNFKFMFKIQFNVSFIIK